jgi:4-amino-4-deoxy-L-arabinose transferase-like glycosyltransferase
MPPSAAASSWRVAWSRRSWSLFAVAELTLLCLAGGIHLAAIDEVPRGLYVDECSIGVNAHLIATTGRDEHHVWLPLFFEAFGEYKNPLYIYFMALVFRVLGYSVWATRFTSGMCWLLGSWSFYALGRRLWRDELVRLYLIVCLSFTPWIFSLSRVSFELIALFPVLGCALYATYRGFEGERSWRWAIVAGACTAGSLYAYSTFRLLAPLHVLATIGCYAKRTYRRELRAFALAASIVTLPFAGYLLLHAPNLTGRFDSQTYLHSGGFSATEKLGLFWSHYQNYLGVDFLITAGDSNRRHHTGYGGELLVVTGLLMIAAVLALWEEPPRPDRRFLRLLLCGLLIAPIAAALTAGTEHSLRAFSLAFFAVMVSAIGLDWLRNRLGTPTALVLVSFTMWNAASYLTHYFTDYPDQSTRAFESFGFEQALQRATNEAAASHGRVLFAPRDAAEHILADYYAPMLSAHVGMAQRENMRPGDVLIFRDPQTQHPALHEGLPERSLFAVQRYDQPSRTDATSP